MFYNMHFKLEKNKGATTQTLKLRLFVITNIKHKLDFIGL